MWKKGEFEGKDVWVQVDADGRPEISGGRVPIRYTAGERSKVYRAGAARVTLNAGAPIEALATGVPAEASAPVTSLGKAGTRTAAQSAAAKAQARTMIESLGADTAVVFTDGASKGNPGSAGAGAAVVLPDGRRGEASWKLGNATNNVAELSAVSLGLDLLEDSGISKSTPVSILTDSKYAHGVLMLSWKAQANRELILDLRQRLKAWPNVSIRWVAGHVGVEGNERADALANDGVAGITARRWLGPK